jgi:transposase
MPDKRTKYDEEFKKNAVQLSYASPRSVREVAEDLGISEPLLYRWRKKYTKDGDKTKFATLEEENRDLRRQLAEARIEADMLRKATAYFANLRKEGMRL